MTLHDLGLRAARLATAQARLGGAQTIYIPVVLSNAASELGLPDFYAAAALIRYHRRSGCLPSGSQEMPLEAALKILRDL